MARERKQVQGTCALCLTHEELRNSHIIPEWIYEPLYGSKHRFIVGELVDDSGPAAVYKPVQNHQKGLREQLLCQACECMLSDWEGHAKDVLFARRRITHHLEKTAIRIENVDYDKFRLFYLSLLWRMSMSTRTEFRDIQLGVNINEDLRQKILSSAPGDPSEFGCLICVFGDDNSNLRIMFLPQQANIKGKNIYYLVTPGFLWILTIGALSFDPIIAINMVKPTGVMRISRLSLHDFMQAFGVKRFSGDTPARLTHVAILRRRFTE